MDTWWDAGTVWITLAVGHVDGMNAGHVEDSEGDGGGRDGTVAAVAVAKLEGSAEVFERDPCKMRPSPVLKKKMALVG